MGGCKNEISRERVEVAGKGVEWRKKGVLSKNRKGKGIKGRTGFL